MKGNSLLLFILFAIVSGCTILSDEDLEDLPENIKLNGIDLNYYNDNTTTSHSIAVSESDKTIELDWLEGVAVFFYDKNIKRTVYELNAKGWAEKITNTFEDGTVMEDVIVYNDSDQVIELSNSFFNDNYLFYYKNDLLDSVAKTRTQGNESLKGFYKVFNSDEYEIIYNSIFPYDDSQPYLISNYLDGTCSTAPLDPNEFNRSIYRLPGDYYYSDDYYGNTVLNNYTSFYTNESLNCWYEPNQSIYSYSNYYGKAASLSYYKSNNSNCGNCDYNYPIYMNAYLMMPDLFPDVSILNMINSANEWRWIYDNIDSPSSQADDPRIEVNYNYVPAN